MATLAAFKGVFWLDEWLKGGAGERDVEGSEREKVGG